MSRRMARRRSATDTRPFPPSVAQDLGAARLLADASPHRLCRGDAALGPRRAARARPLQRLSERVRGLRALCARAARIDRRASRLARARAPAAPVDRVPRARCAMRHASPEHPAPLSRHLAGVCVALVARLCAGDPRRVARVAPRVRATARARADRVARQVLPAPGVCAAAALLPARLLRGVRQHGCAARRHLPEPDGARATVAAPGGEAPRRAAAPRLPALTRSPGLRTRCAAPLRRAPCAHSGA
jgi:hypothetical protein